MAPDVSIIVADPSKIAAIRECLSFPGRVMPFASGSVASALESVRAYRPKVVAIDAIFAQTPPGAAFLDYVGALAIPGSSMLLLVECDGRWAATPLGGAATPSRSRSSPVVAAEAGLVAPSQQVVAALSTISAAHASVNTRRAPRFLVRGPLDVAVESGCASLVDLSVLGAQIVSLPVLRPHQKINVALPDSEETMNLIAQVAWSTFEKPQPQTEPYYRVGLEFTDAAQQSLEAYRQRHCGDQPIPVRTR